MKEIIGIIGAMDTEISSLCKAMDELKTVEFGGLLYNCGKINGKEVIVVKSGVGKVNAALCAQALIYKFGAAKVINTGIAGAMAKGLGVFDFVVSSSALYHDFDVTIFGYKPGQVPKMPEAFTADESLISQIQEAFAKSESSANHKMLCGVVASGDQFIGGGEKKSYIKNTFNPACVEMEGCAIAHTCALNKIPFVIVRCMSDMADDTAEKTYDFNEDIAAKACADVILEFLKN